MLIALILAAFVVVQTATAGASIEWDYDDADLLVGPIAVFLVCLDAQPTAACAQVPATGGTAGPTSASKTYRWKLPPLLAGSHSVAVQACTAGAGSCSTGSAVTFQFVAIANPKNVRIGGGG